MRKLFGTDGIRGIANVDPMSGEMALQLGRATAYIFKNREGRHRIVIGKDTRLSGYMLETALASGICSMGVDVLLVGPLPTPGIAFITTSMRADAGVVISASHNPFYDNGIKIFSRDGFKLPDRLEAQIENLIFSNSIDSFRPTAKEVGKAYRIEDAVGRYVVFLKNTFPNSLTLDGLKIVLDCANGAAYKVAPAVLEELGAEVIPIGIEPDGENINLDCGSLCPQKVSELVIQKQAHLGMALDGDGDRVVFVDQNGQIVDGDHIMAICAIDMAGEEKLKNKTVVTTVMSTIGLDLSLGKLGIRVIRTAVGDRYVVEEMVKGGHNLGGEQSGHTIFLDYNTTGDGILTALQVLSIIVRKQRPLHELAKSMVPLPQVQFNATIDRQIDVLKMPEIGRKIKAIERELGKAGRILTRYSGTEPVLRIMLEGEDEDKIARLGRELMDSVSQVMEKTGRNTNSKGRGG
ncbi:MAG: phosphoglucosamine mutase [Syntrophobacterales bacterium]|nr:MAG: phosphoglucosamine mutase [Syntrophobacterales bacterium]